jgi:NAD-dependent DNA ligase
MKHILIENIQNYGEAALLDEIMGHKKKYYDGKPEISDVDYDRLEQSFEAVWGYHPGIVGYDPKLHQQITEKKIELLKKLPNYSPTPKNHKS